MEGNVFEGVIDAVMEATAMPAPRGVRPLPADRVRVVRRGEVAEPKLAYDERAARAMVEALKRDGKPEAVAGPAPRRSRRGGHNARGVICVSIDRERRYASIRAAALATGVSATNIYRQCEGISNRLRRTDYRFRYAG